MGKTGTKWWSYRETVLACGKNFLTIIATDLQTKMEDWSQPFNSLLPKIALKKQKNKKANERKGTNKISEAESKWMSGKWQETQKLSPKTNMEKAENQPDLQCIIPHSLGMVVTLIN